MLPTIIRENDRFKMMAKGGAVEISGYIDIPHPKEIMSGFFKQVHEAAVNSNIKELKVDVRKLYFMNSSGIKEFTSWILKQSQLPTDKKYSIIFQCDPAARWQKVTFTCLVWLNHEYVRIDKES